MAKPERITRILIADDHLIFRLGVRTLFSTESTLSIVGEASTAETAIEQYNQLQPDIVLLDLRMPQAGGLEVVRAIIGKDPGARILIVTSYEMEEEIFQVMQAGARGYILKDADHSTMLEAVRQVSQGHGWMPERIAARLADRNARKALTPRELEIANLLVRGLTNAEIGSVLSIAENTVKNHIYSLLAKLHVADRAEAVAFLLSRGIVKADDL